MSTYALITGGTKGIGKAICHTLARAGYHIATCSRHNSDLDKLKQELDQYGVEVLTAEVDMRISSQVRGFADRVAERWPKLDVLVNNAGVFVPGAILSEDEGSLELMMETNLYSAYHLIRQIIPSLLKSDQAHIFNMCSIASKIAYPNGGSYSISKFALLGFSKVLREELKEQGIKVTAVLPGATWSASWEGADFPEDRLMQAQDIADAVFGALRLGPAAVVEEIVIRPQLGDL
jgi:short-subunit dehydrogenase